MTTIAAPDLPAAYRVLRGVSQGLPGLSAFEAMWPSYYAYACKSEGQSPLQPGKTLTLLIEIQSAAPVDDQSRLIALLETLMEEEVVLDAAIAQSESQCETFWALRDANSELQQHYDALVGFDVSLMPDAMADFLEACNERLQALGDGIELLCFGHLGDGNLHLVGVLDQAPQTDTQAVKDCVLGTVHDWRGSISAEHGIGLDKLAYLPLSRSPPELALMRRIKDALDPRHILNPGKLLAET